MKRAKAAKKKIGRPVGRRPLLNLRVDQSLHDRLSQAAAASNRTVAEETVRLLYLSLEWTGAEAEVRKWRDENMAALKNGFKAALRQAGYQAVQDINGTFWAEPGMDTGKFTGVINPAIEDALERIVERAMRKANKL
jgi:hypothetical protein